jgi:hypothetical protein
MPRLHACRARISVGFSGDSAFVSDTGRAVCGRQTRIPRLARYRCAGRLFQLRLRLGLGPGDADPRAFEHTGDFGVTGTTELGHAS